MKEVAAVAIAGVGVIILVDALAGRRNPIHARLAPYLAGGEHTAQTPGQAASVAAPLRVWTRLRRSPGMPVLTAVVGVSVVLLGVSSGRVVAGLVAGAAIAPGGLVLVERRRRMASRVRRERLRAEVPVVADLTTIAISAGETVWKSLDLAAGQCRGPLGGELRRALERSRQGDGFTPAMDELCERVDDVALRRFVDTLAVSRQRGTPVAESLRTLAADLREERRSEMVAESGARQVLMLVPVVVLVLPAALLVTFWPAVVSLQQVVRAV